MKKFLILMVVSVLSCVAVFSFVACGNSSPAEYKMEDYFEYDEHAVLPSYTWGDEFVGSPFIDAKTDVKVIKVTGTLYYDPDDIDHDTKFWLGENITTDMFVEQVTFPSDSRFSFNFEVTPESSQNCSAASGRMPSNGVFKKGDGVRVAYLPKTDGSGFIIRNLNIEFKPV